MVAWFASFEADVVIEFVVPEDAMVKQLLRNRDELDFGYTQDCFEAAAAEHLVLPPSTVATPSLSRSNQTA